MEEACGEANSIAVAARLCSTGETGTTARGGAEAEQSSGERACVRRDGKTGKRMTGETSYLDAKLRDDSKTTGRRRSGGAASDSEAAAKASLARV